MSHTEGEPRSAFTMLNIAQNDIELDKTRDSARRLGNAGAVPRCRDRQALAR